MNKKRIAQTQLAEKKATEKKDPRNSLLLCAGIVIGITVLCFVFTELYQKLGTLAENYSVDIERNGTLVHRLCEIGAPLFFYLNSFLGTATFFVGAAYICRFAFIKKPSKSIAAAIVLTLSMYSTTLVALAGVLIRRMTGEFIRLADPAALIFDLVFLVFRVLVIWALAHLFAKKGAAPRTYALASAVFMLVCALAIEFTDTTLPFILSGMARPADWLTMVFAYGLYAVHSVVGYIIVKKFLEGKRAQG